MVSASNRHHVVAGCPTSSQPKILMHRGEGQQGSEASSWYVDIQTYDLAHFRQLVPL